MRNPINVTKTSMPEFEEFILEIKDLWDSHWLTNMGKKHKELERQLLQYLNVPNVTLFSNGHMALELCIEALGLTGEIITTPFTFASTTHAIVRNGLKPVFCDIDPVTFTIDPSRLEQLITNETSAILPVHVYGSICDIETIDSLAKKYGLYVLYDAAHAFGVKRNGRGIGEYGDASMFSFHATKVYHTIEGGAITYADENLKIKLDLLKNFGISGKESVEVVGANAKMNEFQAAMGICNLRHIDEEIQKRKIVSDRYAERLGNVPGIKLSAPQTNVESNYAYFPIVFDGYKSNRDQITDTLARENIFARKYFYPLTNNFAAYRDRFGDDTTPIAKYISERVLTLPLYADLSLSDVDAICDIILQ